MEKFDVIVIGCGISGLTTGLILKSKGLRVLLLEKENSVGGVIKTRRIENESKERFIFECGPTAILDTTGDVMHFLKEYKLADDICIANKTADKRFILRNKQLVEVPMSPLSIITTKLFSISAKIRILTEPFVKKRDCYLQSDESVSEFVKRRLGSEFLNYAIEPFVSGVYAGSPEKLSLKFAFPKVYNLEKEHGSLIKGFIKRLKEKRHSPYRSSILFSFKNGMQSLTEKIYERLSDNIIINCRVLHVRKSTDGYSVEASKNGTREIFNSKIIVFAVPSYELRNIDYENGNATFSLLSRIRYLPVKILHTIFKKEDIGHDLKGFGFLVPRVENLNLLGVIFISSLFPHYAPKYYKTFSAFYGGYRNASSNNLMDLFLSEVKNILKIKYPPESFTKFEINQAIAQYEIGYSRYIESMEIFERENPNVYITGSFRGGVSVADCILNSIKVSGKIFSIVVCKM